MESLAFSLQFALRECATSILLLGNVRTRLVEPLDTRVRYLETLKTWWSLRCYAPESSQLLDGRGFPANYNAEMSTTSRSIGRFEVVKGARLYG
ncbi:hypothetical protein BDD14_4930 [Edaphobacter modestus]|uniref:Uncharacterized protein n=1 Tax=Edaphobacter modestus TaxID=388466 RepID=A0A4V2G585_9BACT|nr:hypothetical protein BDD14_4930 [Edaphobacter modestus]